MNCKEKDCNGAINKNVTVDLMVGCASTRPAHPCVKCGRLHWPSGDAVFNRGGRLVFLVGDNLEYKDLPKKEN